MRSRFRRAGAETGSAAAELALALPAVVLTIMLGVGALSTAATHVALQDAASDAARLLSRGESDTRAHAALAASVPGAQLATTRRDGLVCATVHTDARAGPLAVPLRASACALDGGW